MDSQKSFAQLHKTMKIKILFFHIRTLFVAQLQLFSLAYIFSSVNNIVDSKQNIFWVCNLMLQL